MVLKWSIRNYSLILSSSLRATPAILSNAFREIYSSFKSAYVSGAFSFFANIIRLCTFAKSSIAVFTISRLIGICSPPFSCAIVIWFILSSCNLRLNRLHMALPCRMEHTGLEPVASTLPVWRAPNCANAPNKREYSIRSGVCQQKDPCPARVLYTSIFRYWFGVIWW